MKHWQSAALRSRHIVRLRLFPYLHLSIQAVSVYSSSGDVFSIRSVQVAGAPFEAYSLDVSPDEVLDHEPALGRGEDYDLHAAIEQIEVFRRVEWEEIEPPTHATIGSNPVTIDTGPAAPAETRSGSITVVCGLVLWETTGIKPLIAVFLSDHAGLLATSVAIEDISAYRKQVTSEIM